MILWPSFPCLDAPHSQTHAQEQTEDEQGLHSFERDKTKNLCLLHLFSGDSFHQDVACTYGEVILLHLFYGTKTAEKDINLSNYSTSSILNVHFLHIFSTNSCLSSLLRIFPAEDLGIDSLNSTPPTNLLYSATSELTKSWTCYLKLRLINRNSVTTLCFV